MNPISWNGAYEVFLLFLIPVGGGIPAGVLLGKTRSIPWPVMAVLYFASDVVLAMVFEPALKLILAIVSRSPRVVAAVQRFKAVMDRSIAHYGNPTGPFALVLISFGVDPMTGRMATVAAKYGFVSGWLIAITGDMIYFFVVMASTLWLNNILGNETWTLTIIMVIFLFGPSLIRKLRGWLGGKSG